MLTYGYFNHMEVLDKYIPTLLDLLDAGTDKWDGLYHLC